MRNLFFACIKTALTEVDGSADGKAIEKITPIETF